MKTLSIVIPTHNRHELLKRCLSFFLGLSEEGRLEIIVVDDGSRPDCAQKNEAFCRSFPRCRYVHRHPGRGAPNARNHGASLSRGDFVWFMDDDDYPLKTTVDDVLDAIRGTKWLDTVMLLPMSIVAGSVQLKRVVPNEMTFDKLRNSGPEVSTSCVVFPRSLVDLAGGWDENLIAGQDTDLFLRVSKHAKSGCLETNGVVVEWDNPDRITRSFFRQQIGKLQFLRKHWRVLSMRRRMTYLAAFLLAIPCLAGLRIRMQCSKAKQIASVERNAGSSGPKVSHFANTVAADDMVR